MAVSYTHLIRHKLGVHTVLGVSNISFGLPRRELVTSTFFAMAMQRGLSSGIILSLIHISAAVSSQELSMAKIFIFLSFGL